MILTLKVLGINYEIRLSQLLVYYQVVLTGSSFSQVRTVPNLFDVMSDFKVAARG